MMIDKWIALVKAHERLLLAGGLLYLLLTLGHLYLDRSADKAQVGLGAAQQTLAETTAQNQDLAAQLSVQAAQYQKLAITTQKQVAALQAALAARDSALVVRQQADQTAPPADLANRWATLIQGAPGAVSPGPGADLTVTEPAARATVSALEEVPVLRQDLGDEKAISLGQGQQLVSLAQVNEGLGKQAEGLRNQLTDADKACQAQIKVVKAEARKSKLRWFLLGGGVVEAIKLYFFHTL